MPPSTATVVINRAHVVVATGPVNVASMTVRSTARLDLDGSAQAVTFTVGNGGHVYNAGTVRVLSDANAVTVAGEAGGTMAWDGVGLSWNGKKLYIGRLTYNPLISMGSGDQMELMGDVSFSSTFTTAAGSSVIQGANNILELGGDTTLASSTFTRGTGTSRVRFKNAVRVDAGGQHLGKVETAP